MNVPLWLFISCVVLAGLVGWVVRSRIADYELRNIHRMIQLKEKLPYWKGQEIVEFRFRKSAIRKIECKVKAVGE